MNLAFLNNMKIQTKLVLLLATFGVGFVTFGLTAAYTISNVRVLGPNYNRIVLDKDLLADVLPPPNFIVESYLMTHLMPDTMGTPAYAQAKIDFVKTKELYLTRLEHWKNTLPDTKFKASFIEKTSKPALEFFRVVEEEMMPLYDADKREAADEILNDKLPKLYNEHRAAIDFIVQELSDSITHSEQDVAAIVTRRIYLLLSVGIGMCFIVTLISFGIRRSIIAQEAKESKGQQLALIMEQISDNALTLSTSAEELTIVSANMVSTSAETASQASVVSAASDQVSKNVQTVATGVEEMNSAIHEIAKNATESAHIAQQAVNNVHAANEKITKLGDSSSEIGKVIKVITSIAEQTNLLALNATIEAARAGEAGKGFAVVANEVKELAKETARATEDISRKIETIQSDTEGAIDSIREIGHTITQVSDISNTIASAVEEQTATAAEMRRNVQEAAKGTSEIAANINSLAESVANTSQGVANWKQAAEELACIALNLQHLGENHCTDVPHGSTKEDHSSHVMHSKKISTTHGKRSDAFSHVSKA
jgi:Methyl-accepting chemotaxis protein (MCP) signalling domain